MNFDLSVVIPAYNEESNIVSTIRRLEDHVKSKFELIVVVDSEIDTTIRAFNSVKSEKNSYRIFRQDSQGPSNAIRYGFRKASSDCVIVTMADGSDDFRDIDKLVDFIRRGVSVACASRYMKGGAQIGGPKFKKFLSKSVGKVLFYTGRVGTRDPTNSFKAYSREFIKSVQLQSETGFTIGLELVIKAHKLGHVVTEIPTIWIERSLGDSNFKLIHWIPSYLKWFFYAFKPYTHREQNII
jgi:dolichol-phosphate mannosyltransferase